MPTPVPAPAAPGPEQQQTPAQLDELARDVASRHARIKASKFGRDLTAEKYLMHVDGEGDSQWVEIFYGTRLQAPIRLGDSLRLQENLLRPLLRNFVAYLTSQPLEFSARARADRQSRDRAKIDTVWANTVSRQQRLNRLLRGAMGIASVYGFCPVHATWRDDSIYQETDPVALAMGQGSGSLDFWVGDPWETCLDEDSTRQSVRRASYARVLPLELVARAWQTDAAGRPANLKGSAALPSTSRFQRIARLWQGFGGQAHGTAALGGALGKGQEHISLVFDEMLPGVDPEWPQGRLVIVGLSGTTETGRTATDSATAVPLYVGPLPGKRFSFVRFYSDDRFDDPYGKPWLADLDDHQIRLNQYITLMAELGRRLVRPPLAVTGEYSLADDASVWDDDAILEIHGQGGSAAFLTLPTNAVQQLAALADQERTAMFRIGSWQASSRGESNSGDPASKVVALAQYDDTLLANANSDYRHACSELLQLGHCLAKQHLTAPMLVEAVGRENAYIVQSYITREQLSETPPDYEVVSGFGVTPEQRAQQLLQLVAMRGADGLPLMSTEQMWKRWPDPSMRPEETGAGETRVRRAMAINQSIRDLADQLKAEVEQLPEQWRQTALGQAIPLRIQDHMQEWPILRDDNPMLHVETLSQITQDPTEDPIARQVAQSRQDLLYQWMAAMQAQAAAAAAGPTEADESTESDEPQTAPGRPQPRPGPMAPTNAGTQTSNAIAGARKEVGALTEQAKAM